MLNAELFRSLTIQNTATTRPYSLRVFSKHGSVTVAIPRSFVGPVTLRTRHGSVRVSDEIAARMTTFSEDDGARECFIGNADAFRKSTYLYVLYEFADLLLLMQAARRDGRTQ